MGLIEAILRFLYSLFGHKVTMPAPPAPGPAVSGDKLTTSRRQLLSVLGQRPELPDLGAELFDKLLGTTGPTGPVRTLNPKGQPFGIDWSVIMRWLALVRAASAESGVPVARILGHIVIESQGKPDAVQQNNANGWSYGLLQVVPRWWRKEIERLAGRTFASDDAAGQAMLADPALAIRAGAAVLASYYRQFGTWDAASSGFFIGKASWQGANSVNGTRGGDYRRALNELIAEFEAGTAVSDPPADDTGEALAAAARRLIGKRYVHGTAGPETFDCSGLVAYVVQQVLGQSITRSSYDQIKLGTAVPADKIAIGDLLFWDTERNGTAGHVAISSGVGKAISAFNAQKGVIEHGIDAATVGGAFLGARRRAGQAVPVDPKGPAPRIENIRDAATQAKYGLTAAQAKALIGKCYPGRNGKRPEVIVLHIQGGYTGGSLRHWLGVQASATFMANKDGTLVKVTSETDSPWTNGDNQNPDAQARALMARFGNDLNVVALTIEAEGLNDEPLSDQQFASILWQVRDWQERYPWITNDRILGHYQINAVERSFCGRYKDRIVAALAGGTVPSLSPSYAPLRPVAATWDGSDLVTGGSTFYALRRRFTAIRAGVPVRQYASATAAEVRAPLAKGEVIESDWLVRASDGDWWVVTRTGDRVPAAGLHPIVTVEDAA